MPRDLFDFSVAQLDDRVRERRGFQTVSRNDGRGVLLSREAPDQFKYYVARRRVEIARRFVGQQDAR